MFALMIGVSVGLAALGVSSLLLARSGTNGPLLWISRIGSLTLFLGSAGALSVLRIAHNAGLDYHGK